MMLDLINYWKPREIERLRQLRADGQPLKAIAIALGRSFRSVAWQIRSLGIKRTEIAWTAYNIEILQQRHAAGDSFSTIANAIGATRNACIGKAQRLGLPQRSKAPPRPRPARKVRFQAPRLPTEPVPHRVPPPPSDALPPRNLTILELAYGDCRWPVTNEPPHLFCANPAWTGPYCHAHMRLALARPREVAA